MTETARCANHPERESIVTCHGCSRPFCDDCVVRFEKLSLCASCKAKFLVDVDARPASTAAPAARDPAPPRPAGSALPWLGGAVALGFAALFVFVIIGSLAKEYRGWQDDRSLADAFERIATVGAALERFHLDSGKYPDDLAALVPKYLNEIPRDPYGGAIHYATNASGRRIWSIGPDGKDDHGAPPADIALMVELAK